MKFPPPLPPAKIGGGGLVVSTRPLPTQPEMALTLVKPGGAVDPPSPATVPSLLSASPAETATTLLKPVGTLTPKPETVPSLRNMIKELKPLAAIPTMLLAPLKPNTEELVGTVPSLPTPM